MRVGQQEIRRVGRSDGWGCASGMKEASNGGPENQKDQEKKKYIKPMVVKRHLGPLAV